MEKEHKPTKFTLSVSGALPRAYYPERKQRMEVAQVKIEHSALQNDLTKGTHETNQLEEKINQLEERTNQMEEQINQMEEQINQLKERTNQLEERTNQLKQLNRLWYVTNFPGRIECRTDLRMETKLLLGNLPFELGEVIVEFIPVGNKYQHIDEIAYCNSKEEILEYLEDFPLQDEVYKFLKENLLELPKIKSLFYEIRNYQKVPANPPYTDFDRIKELANSFWTRKVMSQRKETFLSVLKVLEKMILYLGLKKLQENHVLFNIRYFPTGNRIKN